MNFPDKQLGVADGAGTAMDLIAVRFHSTTTSYVTGDYVVQGGQLWQAKGAVSAGAFNQAQWNKAGGAVFVSDTAPSSPSDGALWWDSVSGQLFVWYNDGTSQQWVVANPSNPPAATVNTFNGRTGAVTLTATDVDNAGGVLVAGDTMAGVLNSVGTTGTISAAGTLQGFVATAVTGAGNAAFMGFHRPGAYAGQFGLDTDNAWKVGGFSMGAVAYRVIHEGLSSPALAGAPTAATAAPGTSTQQIATTAFVAAAVAPAVDSVTVQKFTANGTWTPTAGTKFAVIECVGGGGGGGGTINSTTSNAASGGGGGAGGYSRKVVASPTALAVTVGAGGTAGSTAGGDGGAGGATSVGSVCIANGGSGGGGAASNAVGGLSGSGAATAGAVGDITAAGTDGGRGTGATIITVNSVSGYGGAGPFGGGAAGVLGAAGNAGGGYGSGGSGGHANNATGARAGGAGAPGVVVITEYS